MGWNPVLVLRSSGTVSQGLRQLEAIGTAETAVVLIREHHAGVQYFVEVASALRERLTGESLNATLADVLDLGARKPSPAAQLNSTPAPGSVVLLGREVLGVMGAEPLPPPPPRTRGGVPRNQTFALEEPVPPSIGLPSRGGLDMAAPAKADPGGEQSAVADERALFRAYPDLSVPAQVRAQEAFTLSVGFSRTPPPTQDGPPVLVMTEDNAEFVIQATGFGFSFPSGSQRSLTVDRDEPEGRRVDFTVLADPSSAAAPRFLEVSYESGGVVVGRAWAQVQVAPGAAIVGSAQVVVGGSDVLLPEGHGDAPHLSVDIISRGGGSELGWVFHCPFPEIPRPEGVTTTLHEDSAQSLALRLMRQVPNLTALVDDSMRGIGREIADALPDEFWAIAEQTWKRARGDGEQPRMQITTTDPWIPWELAWVDRELLGEPDSMLKDCPEGATLGELWQIGRWMTPIHRLPQSPPTHRVDVSKMAVVIGDYAGTAVPELPAAVEEGKTLARDYGAMPLDVSVAMMDQLMHCRLRRDGAGFAPTAIHFAGHGRSDLANPQYTGLRLGGGYTLDPMAIRGSDAIRKQRPFVFLNACEAGVGGETIMALGGLVGAFLSEGARGFVAPLWRVDDAEAHDIALEFYRRTIGEAQTVGEAMRAIRGRFRAGQGSTTALAYIFYGDPALRLTR